MSLNIDEMLARLYNANLFELANKIDEQQRAEFFVLNHLHDNLDKDITPGDITEVYGVSTARTAKILNQLKSKKMIKKIKSNLDGRKFIIKLTDFGKKFVMKKRQKNKELMTKLIKHIGIEEFEKFIFTIEKMHKFFTKTDLSL